MASVGPERLVDLASLFLLAFAALLSMPTCPAGGDGLSRGLRTAGICPSLLTSTLVIALGAHPKARVLAVGLVADALFILVIASLGLAGLGNLAWSNGGKQGGVNKAALSPK